MERKRPFEPAPREPQTTDYTYDVLIRDVSANINSELPNTTQNLEFQVLEAPPGTGFDFGVNLVKISKNLSRSPQELAKELANKINSQDHILIEEADSMGPFLNFKLNIQKFGGSVLEQIFDLKDGYGKETVGKGQKVVVDMSSPNIAKRMTYGHLRSTIIGDALANIYRAEGYDVVRDNHLGDWGTQFGKQIVAIKRWGDEDVILHSEDPVEELQELYVKFHSEVEKDAAILRKEAKDKWLNGKTSEVPGLAEAIEDVSQEIMERKKIGREQLEMADKVVEDALDRVIVTDLEKEGREWFLKLENGDPEARRIWKLCMDLSIKEFNKIYDILGVSFELTLGESFYENKLRDTINIVKSNRNSSTSKGALGFDLNNVGLGFAMVEKSDGASVYMTRDIAGAIYRQKELKADKILYVVGGDQQYYFKQLFEVLRRLGYKVGENSQHVYFGMVSLPQGEKMSTRKGKVILLRDVIDEGLKRAEAVLKQKNPDLANNKELKGKVVRQVAVGALKWNDLSQDPKRSIEFNWDRALKLDGNSAPYVQYTAVRAKSIVEAAGLSNSTISSKDFVFHGEDFNHETEKALLRKLSEYPSVLSETIKEDNPSKIATFVYDLAKRFNAFYTNVPVLKSETENLRRSRLLLTAASIQVITNALGILGIEVPERM